MLTPNCFFNSEKKTHEFVFEGEEVFVCRSSEKLVEDGKKLVQLLHGEKILEVKSQKPDEKKFKPDFQKILERARSCVREKTRWHHHLLFPECTFNESKEKYVIVFEEEKTGEKRRAEFEKNPEEELREIEILFYELKKLI